MVSCRVRTGVRQDGARWSRSQAAEVCHCVHFLGCFCLGPEKTEEAAQEGKGCLSSMPPLCLTGATGAERGSAVGKPRAADLAKPMDQRRASMGGEPGPAGSQNRYVVNKQSGGNGGRAERQGVRARMLPAGRRGSIVSEQAAGPSPHVPCMLQQAPACCARHTGRIAPKRGAGQGARSTGQVNENSREAAATALTPVRGSM